MSQPILDFARRHMAKGTKIDSGLLVAVLVGLLAALPFLMRPSLPHQTDAELHVYRTAELGHLIDGGVLYPRWAANLYLGYGYPLFHYYAPFTYHLGHAFATVLPGAGIVAATKAVFVSGLLLASLGAYLLGRALFQPSGGVLAATSFTLSPYVVFIDPHARGALAEHFAICLLPLTLYLFHRLLARPGPWRLGGASLALAILVFSHNLLGLVASAILFAYWTWQTLMGTPFQRTRWGLAAFAVAAGLIAFFWLPALLEYHAVKLEVIGPGHFDFREHFSSLAELLGPSLRIDWGAVGPRFHHNLGPAQWLLALPALGALVQALRQHGRLTPEARQLTFFIISAAGLVFLMLPVSTPVWEIIPGMPYLQFPWRLLGPTNLMLAVCAAGGATLLPPRPWRAAPIAGGLALLLVTALPLLYPAPWEADFGGTDAHDIIAWERESQALGTTSTGDFLPASVEVIPSASGSLVESYVRPGPIDKVNRATLKEGTNVAVVSHGPTHDLFDVTTARPFVLRLYTFHFPGWTAYVDGAEVPIEIGRPEGFITVRIPEGRHEVLIRFEDTLVRKVGWGVAVLSLAVLVGVLLLWRPEPGPAGEKTDGGFGGRAALCMILLVAAAGVVRGFPGAARGWAYVDSAPGSALPAQQCAQANFAGEIELIGYDLPQKPVRPGDKLDVVLYWRALKPPAENYQSFVHVAQPLDRVWAQEDHLNPGGLPTRRWPTDAYVWDEYVIEIPPGTPEGVYSVNVGIYVRSEGRRLERRGEGNQPASDSFVVGTVIVSD